MLVTETPLALLLNAVNCSIELYVRDSLNTDPVIESSSFEGPYVVPLMSVLLAARSVIVFKRPMVSNAQPRFGPEVCEPDGPYDGYCTDVILPSLSYV